MKALRLLVCGAAGRMGAQVCALAQDDPRFEVSSRVGRDTPADELEAGVDRADVLVDFSSPEASVRFARLAAGARKPIVVGTTGLSAEQAAALKTAARKTAVFWAPNFSPGVVLLYHLAKQAAAALPSHELGVSEVHHSKKKDAPSGTAIALARATGKNPPIVSQRLGDVIGEHTLTLAGPFERLELTHRAHSRALFAQGALDAAAWTAKRKPGLYGMDDLLGLR